MTQGTLKEGEFHPAATIAYQYIQDFLDTHDQFLLIEAMANCALSGNRTSEIASETLLRFLTKQPVSDRYLMGLAWCLWKLDDSIAKRKKSKKKNARKKI